LQLRRCSGEMAGSSGQTCHSGRHQQMLLSPFVMQGDAQHFKVAACSGADRVHARAAQRALSRSSLSCDLLLYACPSSDCSSAAFASAASACEASRTRIMPLLRWLCTDECLRFCSLSAGRLQGKESPVAAIEWACRGPVHPCGWMLMFMYSSHSQDMRRPWRRRQRRCGVPPPPRASWCFPPAAPPPPCPAASLAPVYEGDSDASITYRCCISSLQSVQRCPRCGWK